MKYLFIAAPLLALIAATSFAADTFSCESIKEKKVRDACVKSGKPAIANKQSRIDGIVEKAKIALTENYKDPSSAQFTNLRLREVGTRITVCGSVNAKNSYGGYTGSKMFIVTWDSETPSDITSRHEKDFSNLIDSAIPDTLEIVREAQKTQSDIFYKLCDSSENSAKITLLK